MKYSLPPSIHTPILVTDSHPNTRNYSPTEARAVLQLMHALSERFRAGPQTPGQLQRARHTRHHVLAYRRRLVVKGHHFHPLGVEGMVGRQLQARRASQARELRRALAMSE